MNSAVRNFSLSAFKISLPMPVLPVVEDVGWWHGEDGSGQNQPYRNAFPRAHCLEDYRALVRFADGLGVRLPLAMVLCEWDRDNLAYRIPGATWAGSEKDRVFRQRLPLEETAAYLQQHSDRLEVALHGFCHEFWQAGQMERSEFHDRDGGMRPTAIIEQHLLAFAELLEQFGFTESPRLFIPPALYHSFGNGDNSIQALLSRFGIRYVITLFSRARLYRPPQNEHMAWEAGVALLNRGEAPVKWNVPASPPQWDFSGPILPLHWGNLIHPDAERNNEVIDAWVELLRSGTSGLERMLAPDLAACWNQAAVYYYGHLEGNGKTLAIDLQGLPEDLPLSDCVFYLKARGVERPMFRSEGAKLSVVSGCEREEILLQLQPLGNFVRVFFDSDG